MRSIPRNRYDLHFAKLSMPNRPANAICLIIDGLHCGYLGAYGNTWLSTPHWDRLASESLVFDFAYLDSPQLELSYRSFWRGIHAACPDLPPGALEPTLAERLGQAGIWTNLVADDPLVANHPLAVGFDNVLSIPDESGADDLLALAEHTGDTALVRFFAGLLSRIDGESEPFLLWGHCGSLGKVWDAPADLRRAVAADEEDEDSGPVELDTLFETVPPRRLLESDTDPDELLGLRRAYAAQISLLDRCLGALAEALAETSWGSRTLLVVAGARGFPLGEHRQLGWYDFDLHEELVHIPLMVRFPDRLSALKRSSALVQPADLAMTLADWFALERDPAVAGYPALGRSLLPVARNETEEIRDRLLMVGDEGQRALRTHVWMIRSEQSEFGEQPRPAELFVKPDDRWEVNEVFNRCPEIAAELEAALDELANADRLADAESLRPLSDDCLRGQA